MEAAVQDILTELYSKTISLCRQDKDSANGQNEHGTAASPPPTKGRRGKKKGGGDRCVMFTAFFFSSHLMSCNLLSQIYMDFIDIFGGPCRTAADCQKLRLVLRFCCRVSKQRCTEGINSRGGIYWVTYLASYVKSVANKGWILVSERVLQTLFLCELFRPSCC